MHQQSQIDRGSDGADIRPSDVTLAQPHGASLMIETSALNDDLPHHSVHAVLELVSPRIGGPWHGQMIITGSFARPLPVATPGWFGGR